MKKIMVIGAVILAAISVNAASFKWSGANVYGPDGAKFSGTASLFCDALSSAAISTATVTSGAIAATTFDYNATVGTSYDFYFVIKSGDKSFTSATKSATAPETGAAGIAFGNMQAATQNAANWKGGSEDVPEPTSGMLLLLGLAGLALRRKQA